MAVFQPYAAGSVSCTISAAIAPRRAASSYLYVHRRVVSGRLATELAVRVLTRQRLEVRVVDEVHGNLAVQVNVLVVVPAALRCADAIADEHQRRICDPHPVDGAQCERGHVLLLHQRAPLAGHGDAHGRVCGHLRAHQRHDLDVGATRPGRLKSHSLELLDEVRDGFRLARRARRAPFELIGRQGARDVRQALRVDRVFGVAGRSSLASRPARRSGPAAAGSAARGQAECNLRHVS